MNKKKNERVKRENPFTPTGFKRNQLWIDYLNKQDDELMRKFIEIKLKGVNDETLF